MESNCLNCNAAGTKKWKLYNGMEVCSDCCYDVQQDFNGKQFQEARGLLREPLRPTASKSPGLRRHVRHNPSSVPTPTTGNLTASDAAWGGGRDAVGKGGSRSQPRPRPPWHRLNGVPDAAHSKYKAVMEEVIKPGYNSVCRLCGHIFYGAALSSCSRCGGACALRTDHDLGLMARNPHKFIETTA